MWWIARAVFWPMIAQATGRRPKEGEDVLDDEGFLYDRR